MEECFVFHLLENVPSGDKVERYSGYLPENYMFSYSVFPSKLWSDNDTTSSTNECESFRSRFNSSFYHYPNLYLIKGCTDRNIKILKLYNIILKLEAVM